MDEWPVTCLKDLTLKVTKGTTPTSLGMGFENAGINFIKAESITRSGLIDRSTFAFISEKTHEKLKRSQIQADDILVTIAGVYLAKIGLVKSQHVPANTNQAVAIVRPNKQSVCPEYLKAYLSTSHVNAYLNGLCPQAAQPNLNLTQLGKFSFPLPPLPIQRKIAAILTAYDDLIENNRQRIDLLEKMAEEIYREWFVRLRFPGHEHTPAHKGVPEGWEQTSLFELCRLKRGYDLPKQNVVEGTYPILAAAGIAGFHNEYKAEAPVVTTGRSGSLGTVVWSSKPAWPLNTSLYLVDGKGNSKHFLFFTLKSANLAQFNSGAGVPTLNRNHLSCVRILRPSKGIQAQFDQLIAPIREQTDILQQAIDLLDETRDLLLNRLIAGKLRVDDLEIQFPPSMQSEAA